jgi:hypothetical protein
MEENDTFPTEEEHKASEENRSNDPENDPNDWNIIRTSLSSFKANLELVPVLRHVAVDELCLALLFVLEDAGLFFIRLLNY